MPVLTARDRPGGFLNPTLFATVYGVPVEAVIVTAHPAALAIKASMPRPTIQGSLHDTDSYGAHSTDLS